MNVLELDEDGYPTEASLMEIRDSERERRDFSVLLAKVKTIWRYADHGYWSEEDGYSELNGCPVRTYRISTGGWSGNESIISALSDNTIFWLTCWVEHRRGGHFVFEVREGSEDNVATDTKAKCWHFGFIGRVGR